MTSSSHPRPPIYNAPSAQKRSKDKTLVVELDLVTLHAALNVVANALLGVELPPLALVTTLLAGGDVGQALEVAPDGEFVVIGRGLDVGDDDGDGEVGHVLGGDDGAVVHADAPVEVVLEVRGDGGRVHVLQLARGALGDECVGQRDGTGDRQVHGGHLDRVLAGEVGEDCVRTSKVVSKGPPLGVAVIGLADEHVHGVRAVHLEFLRDNVGNVVVVVAVVTLAER